VGVEGRFGIVLWHGPTLMQLSRSGAMSPAQTGAILASLYMSVHKTLPPPDVFSLRDRLAALSSPAAVFRSTSPRASSP
jgi:hypothetical protein